MNIENLKIADIMIIIVLAVVSLIGSGCLYGAFKKMKGGFGPQNLRAIVIILVSTFATLIAILRVDLSNAAIGILGAIIGYLFGSSEPNRKSKSEEKDDEEKDDGK